MHMLFSFLCLMIAAVVGYEASWGLELSPTIGGCDTGNGHTMSATEYTRDYIYLYENYLWAPWTMTQGVEYYPAIYGEPNTPEGGRWEKFWMLADPNTGDILTIGLCRQDTWCIGPTIEQCPNIALSTGSEFPTARLNRGFQVEDGQESCAEQTAALSGFSSFLSRIQETETAHFKSEPQCWNEKPLFFYNFTVNVNAENTEWVPQGLVDRLSRGKYYLQWTGEQWAFTQNHVFNITKHENSETDSRLAYCEHENLNDCVANQWYVKNVENEFEAHSEFSVVIVESSEVEEEETKDNTVVIASVIAVCVVVIFGVIGFGLYNRRKKKNFSFEEVDEKKPKTVEEEEEQETVNNI